MARIAGILGRARPHRQLSKAGLIDNLLPTRCLLCGGAGSGMALCPPCLRDMPWLTHACAGCALPLPDAGSRCEACMQTPPDWSQATAVFAHEFPADRLVAALKYHGRLALADCLGGLLADALPPLEAAPQAPLLIPVPVHARRLRSRGYNQALLLADKIARRQGWEVAPGHLVRREDTAMQKGLDKAARQANLQRALAWYGPALRGRHIILVDDVLTTGATLSAASQVLQASGAGRIDAAVVTRTLPA